MVNNEIRRPGKPDYKRCSFTGYRPQKMPFGFDESDPRCIDFKARLHDALEELIGKGFAHFISGGAMGMDMYAAEAVLELKETYPWIILEMVSPFDDQAKRWEPEYQSRHELLFAAADIVTATSHPYTRGCLFKRNRYLVDNADLLLAAYDGQPGGTRMTVEYARETGIPVQCITPNAMDKSA